MAPKRKGTPSRSAGKAAKQAKPSLEDIKASLRQGAQQRADRRASEIREAQGQVDGSPGRSPRSTRTTRVVAVKEEKVDYSTQQSKLRRRSTGAAPRGQATKATPAATSIPRIRLTAPRAPAPAAQGKPSRRMPARTPAGRRDTSPEKVSSGTLRAGSLGTMPFRTPRRPIKAEDPLTEDAEPKTPRASTSVTERLRDALDSVDAFIFKLRANLRSILITVACCIASILSVLIFLAFNPWRTSVPFCGRYDAGEAGCIECPDYGNCESGKLRSCDYGYQVVGGIFGGRQSCQPTFFTWAQPGLELAGDVAVAILGALFVGSISWYLLRRRRRANALFDKFYDRAQELLSEAGDAGLPLSHLEEMILREEFKTSRALRQGRPAWARVERELKGDRRLRTSEKVVCGEKQSYIRFVSPVQLRPKSSEKPRATTTDNRQISFDPAADSPNGVIVETRQVD